MNVKTFEEVRQRFLEITFEERFDLIVAVANGGIIPAAMLNQRLNLDMQLLKLHLRDADQKQLYDRPRLLEEIRFEVKGKKILLVEDRVKTGTTLNYARQLLLGAGAAVTMKWDGVMDIMAQNTSQAGGCDLVAVMGGEPAEMFRKAIAEFGGMGKFVKAGQKVVVKPNIGWDKVPELAGNTNPELVSEIIKQCFDAGAKEVVVFDHTCDDWRKCYKNSGIEEAAKAAGAKVMPAHEESYYREVELPKAKSLKTAKIHSAILDCDVWINVPILKNHGGAKMTISMKNHMGIVWDRGFFHRNDLQQCIADICTISKPAVLNVVDAYRLMKTNGPRGKSEADVVLAKGLFMSPDIVAVDTAATKFFNQVEKMPLEVVGHLAKGEELKIGTMDINRLKVKRIKI